MEPKPLFEELKKFLSIKDLLETSNGVPAINSHESKLKYVGMFSQHAQDWVENNVEDGAGNNIDLNNDDESRRRTSPTTSQPTTITIFTSQARELQM